MVKKLALPVSILLAGIVAITVVMMTKAEPTARPNTSLETVKTKVLVQKAITQETALSVQSNGLVTAKRQVDIVAQVSGVIINVSPKFEEGIFIEPNEMLLQIDKRDAQAALVKAQAQLVRRQRLFAEEKGRARQAKREWRDLGNEDANALFLRKPQLAEAQAEIDAAKADVTIAKLNIERTEVRVPFDARIAETFVDLGQFVSAGTRIAQVYGTAAAEVRLPLSDRDMALLNLPLSHSEQSVFPRVTLSGIVSGVQHDWNGRVVRMESSIDMQSGMHYAIAEIDAPFSPQHDAPLLPGLFVEATVDGKRLDNILVLPEEALISRTNIYTLDANNIVQLTPVSVLNKQDNKIWIKGEFPPETLILLDKHALVSPGLEVDPVMADEAQASLASHASTSSKNAALRNSQQGGDSL